MCSERLEVTMELAKGAWFIRDHGTYKRRPLRFHIYVSGRHGLVIISELRLGPHISVPNFKHTVALKLMMDRTMPSIKERSSMPDAVAQWCFTAW